MFFAARTGRKQRVWRRAGPLLVLFALCVLGAWQAATPLRTTTTGEGVTEIAQSQPHGTEPSAAPSSTLIVLENDWLSAITTETFWRGVKRGKKGSSGGSTQTSLPPPMFNLFGQPIDEDTALPQFIQGKRGEKLYRTVCVRLCDSYYFHISSGTPSSGLSADAAACQSQCDSPARLFVTRSYSDDAGQMRDLDGRSYERLSTAFKYRTSYDAQYTCKAQPWQHASIARHQSYAALAARGDKPPRRHYAARYKGSPASRTAREPASAVQVAAGLNTVVTEMGGGTRETLSERLQVVSAGAGAGAPFILNSREGAQQLARLNAAEEAARLSAARVAAARVAAAKVASIASAAAGVSGDGWNSARITVADATPVLPQRKPMPRRSTGITEPAAFESGPPAAAIFLAAALDTSPPLPVKSRRPILVVAEAPAPAPPPPPPRVVDLSEAEARPTAAPTTSPGNTTARTRRAAANVKIMRLGSQVASPRKRSQKSSSPRPRMMRNDWRNKALFSSY